MKWQRKRSGDVAEHQRQRFRTKKHRMVSCHIVALPLVLRVYVNGDREVTEQTNFNLPRKVPADIVFLYHSHSHGRGLEPWNQLRMKFPSHTEWCLVT